MANKILVPHLWPVEFGITYAGPIGMTLGHDDCLLELSAEIANGRIPAEKWSVSPVKEI
jgi:hypothetical protein